MQRGTMKRRQANMSGAPFPRALPVRSSGHAEEALLGGRTERGWCGMSRLWATVVAALFFLVAPLQAEARTGPSARALQAEDLDGLFAPPAEVPAGWRTEHGVYARVHAHPDDVRVAHRLSRHAEEAVPRLAEALGVPPGATIDIFVAPTQDRFMEMQPGRPPEWADGTAWPTRGLVFLRTPRLRPGTDEPLEQVLDHELVHIVLGRAFAPRPVPHWLQEGAAQLLARQYTPELTERLAMGQLGDSLFSLDSLTRSFPADPVRARLAYAQSADLVAYLQNTYGKQALPTLTLALAQGADVDEALFQATGKDAIALDQEWRARIASSPMWLGPLVADTTLLGGAALMLIFGGIAHRRKRRRVLERWEREEAAQNAVYDALAGEWPGLSSLPVTAAGPRWAHPEPDLRMG